MGVREEVDYNDAPESKNNHLIDWTDKIDNLQVVLRIIDDVIQIVGHASLETRNELGSCITIFTPYTWKKLASWFPESRGKKRRKTKSKENFVQSVTFWLSAPLNFFQLWFTFI